MGGGADEDRYEIFVDAKDLQSEDFPDNYADALIFRGQQKLADQAMVQAFDVTINSYSNLTYKTDYDIGSLVQAVSKRWNIAMTARITEVDETYDRDGISINVTFGKPLLTLAQKIHSDMSAMQTAIQAPSGGGTGEISDGSVTTAKLANGAVTLPKIHADALPSTSNVYAQRLNINTYRDAGAVNLNDYMIFGEFTLYNVTTATNFPPGTWTGTGNTPVLIVQRYWSNASVRQILTKRNAPAEIYTRTASSATAWTAWSKILAVGDNGLIATANIADLAVSTAKIADLAITAAKIANSTITTGKIATGGVATANIADLAVTTAKLAASAATTAKTAQEADTSITLSWGTGVSMAGTQNSYTNKGVVVLGFQFQVTAGVAPNGLICTITNLAFRPYTTVRSVLVPVPTGTTTVPITIESNGASGTTLPTGYYMISVTYAKA